MANLMGFKKTNLKEIPLRCGCKRSMYDAVIDAVLKSGDTYSLDTNDQKRAYNLTSQINYVIRKRGIRDKVKASVRGTTVYVVQV